MFFFGIALIIVIFYLFKGPCNSSENGGQSRSPEASPLDILKTRYALEEFDKEGFEFMKKDLS